MIKEPILWDKKFQDIYTESLERIKENAPEYSALLPSDPGIAVLDASLYQTLELAQRLNLLPKASLVAWVNYLGIIKKGAVAAKGTVRVTLEGPLDKDFVIPKGTKFMDSRGLGFDSLEEVIIRAGETIADVPVECERKGSVGNAKPYSIVNIYQRLPYIKDISNPEAMAGGFDSELDDETLDRGRKIISHLWRAVTVEDYEEIARAVPGVYKARAIDAPGVVSLYVLSMDGQPANTTILKELLVALTPLKTQGVGLNVLPASIKTIDVTIRAYLRAGYTHTAVSGLLRDKLSGSINPKSWQWGRKVSVSEILALAEETQGIDYVEELLLPAENIRLEPFELATMGEVNLIAL